MNNFIISVLGNTFFVGTETNIILEMNLDGKIQKELYGHSGMICSLSSAIQG
jgi:hypothetical protein